MNAKRMDPADVNRPAIKLVRSFSSPASSLRNSGIPTYMGVRAAALVGNNEKKQRGT